MTASVTTGRALRYAGAPRAASYTNRWDTALDDIEAFEARPTHETAARAVSEAPETGP